METPVKRMVVWMVMGFCLMGYPFGALGQTRDITLRQYASAQGLSQSTVTTLYLDSRGLLWAGTCSGLNLLQGSSLIRMDQKKSSQPQLTDNAIRSISSSGSKGLLIGTEGGAYRYDFRKQKLQKEIIPALKLNDQMVKPFRAGRFICYVTRENKLLRVDTSSGRAQTIHYQQLEGKQSFTVHQHTAYWLSAKPYKLYRLDGLTGKVTFFSLPDLPETESPSYVSVARNGEVLITYAKGLLMVNPATGQQQYHTLESLGLPGGALPSRAIFAVRAPDQTLWIGIREQGVFQLSSSLKILSSYTDVYDDMGRGVFNLWAPICCVVDDAGNVFVGTDGHGIIKINPSIRKFRHLVPGYLGPAQVTDHFVTAIYQDSSGILYYSCLNSGLLIAHHQPPRTQQILHIRGSAEKIRRIHFMVPWQQKGLLLGTDQGLALYHGGNTIIPLHPEFKSLIFTHCCKLDPNRYLLGGPEGVYMLKDRKIIKINTGNVNQITLLKNIGNNRVLLAERHDRLYLLNLSSDHGILNTVHTPNPEKQTKPVYFQAATTPHHVYVATSFGLLVFTQDLKLTQHITVDDGLADHCIYSLEADRSGRIWMGTNHGLSMLNTTDRIVHNFTMEDGLQAMEFNTGASHFAGQGAMYFGGVNGINVFFPDPFKLNTHPPAILLTGLKIHDRMLNPDSLLHEKRVRFPYFNNSITFSLVANEYTMPERNQIRIKLKGIDQDWISPVAGSEIRYPFLPPGRYTLLGSGANSDGLWTPPHTLLVFTIEKPYWQQGWFLILMMMCITGMAVLGVHLYYRTQHRKKMVEVRQKQAIEAVRSRIAGEMHDDIGAGLTRIALITEQLIREPVMQLEPPPFLEKMGRLSSTSHELIQSLREIVWMTNPAKDSLESLLIFIRKTLNAMTEDSGFEPICDFPSTIPEMEIMPETRRRLSLIVKECINNAVKHSGGDTIVVRFSIDPSNMFELSVTDNGTGISTSPSDHGNGLRNLRQHAGTLNLQLKMVAEAPHGTRVIVSGPIRVLDTESRNIIKNK